MAYTRRSGKSLASRPTGHGAPSTHHRRSVRGFEVDVALLPTPPIERKTRMRRTTPPLAGARASGSAGGYSRELWLQGGRHVVELGPAGEASGSRSAPPTARTGLTAAPTRRRRSDRDRWIWPRQRQIWPRHHRIRPELRRCRAFCGQRGGDDGTRGWSWRRSSRDNRGGIQGWPFYAAAGAQARTRRRGRRRAC